MREYIRHPTDIPLNYRLVDVAINDREYLKDVSEGGLAFGSSVHIDPGSKIEICIPLRNPEFEEEGVVVWCRKANGHFDIGVQFENPSSKFRARMVEQVAHIEHYKNEILEKEGRKMSGEEAAQEWIKKFASEFPK
ncbi:PilZ domain-containing protein [Candidatus Latescibacterota bacterium]